MMGEDMSHWNAWPNLPGVFPWGLLGPYYPLELPGCFGGFIFVVSSPSPLRLNLPCHSAAQSVWPPPVCSPSTDKLHITDVLPQTQKMVDDGVWPRQAPFLAGTELEVGILTFSKSSCWHQVQTCWEF